MNILLYDYQQLEDRSSKKLSVWKAWHTVIYVFAAAFGILNYTFLQSTMQLVDNNCVLYPRIVDFHWVELYNVSADISEPDKSEEESAKEKAEYVVGEWKRLEEKEKMKDKREVSETNGTEYEYVTTSNVTTTEHKNESFVTGQMRYNNSVIFFIKIPIIPCQPPKQTIIESLLTLWISCVFLSLSVLVSNNSSNTTHRLMLYNDRTIFGKQTDCQFAEFMPVLSSIFAMIWATFFIMCPGTGRTTTGLRRPYRILPPALVFALLMVVLTGYSFTTTNGGVHAFCAAFSNYTRATTCSPVNDFLERGWNATWGFGSRAAALRAASAGVWVSWACAAALLLARCLAAPDFVMKRSSVYLVKDPQQKITPYLNKSPRNSQRSTRSAGKDNISTRSEPTMSTEVVTASVDHGPDSDPTSLATTPVKLPDQHGQQVFR